MAPFPIQYNRQIWKTSEALFQALRFEDLHIREAIRLQRSPMGAKMLAKKHKSMMVVEPTSEQDLSIMRLVVKLKFDQHPLLKMQLIQTGGNLLIEDVSARKSGKRNLFWGMKNENGEWIGENNLGKILMDLRKEYIVT